MTVPREEYQKGVLELLYDYHSDETKKNKRNLAVTCFTVLVVYALDLSLTDLNVLGLNLSDGDPDRILWVALIMILYWLSMFYIYFRQDKEIHNERQHVLSQHMDTLESRREELEANNNLDRMPELKSELTNILAAIEIYESQSERLDLARRLMRFARSFEQIFPVVLAIASLWILIGNLIA